MVRVNCDMCRKPIDYDIDGVNLNFSHYGVIKVNGGFTAEKQFCVACAKKISDLIDEQCSQYKKEMMDNVE